MRGIIADLRILTEIKLKVGPLYARRKEKENGTRDLGRIFLGQKMRSYFFPPRAFETDVVSRTLTWGKQANNKVCGL